MMGGAVAVDSGRRGRGMLWGLELREDFENGVVEGVCMGVKLRENPAADGARVACAWPLQDLHAGCSGHHTWWGCEVEREDNA